MKVIICLFLMLMSIPTLFSQSVDLELKMHPELNKLEFNNDPRILLLENDKYGFMLFDPYSRSLIETNENNLVFAGESTLYYAPWFWDPHTKISYLHRRRRSSTDEIPNGWYKLVWNSEKIMVEAELQANWGIVKKSPPIVEILDSRYEMISSFEHHIFVEDQTDDYIQRIIIRDVESGKVYLDNFLRTGISAFDYLWIGGTLILKNKTISFLTSDPNSAPAPESIESLRDLDMVVNTSLYDFVRGYHVSFYPDIIIGYGAGYIITTGSDFIGLRIWDISGKLVYSDEDNTLFRQDITPSGGLLIGLSYFDNPFVYIYFQDAYIISPAGYFIINLQTNEVTVLGSDEFENIDTISGIIHME